MSFDVYFQGFRDGDAAPEDGSGARVRELLEPHIVSEDEWSLLVAYGDGTARIYLDGDGMMANHVSDNDPWELLVQCARSVNWVIMPVGCPWGLTDEGQRAHLPEDFGDDAVVVTTSADLVRVSTEA